MMEEKLLLALEHIIWKLNRRELNELGESRWAKIDIEDVVIRKAQKLIAEYHKQQEA